MKEARVLVDVEAALAWLLQKFATPSPLDRQILDRAFDLHSRVVLALVGRERLSHLDRADANNQVLRALLRFAFDQQRLDEPALVHITTLLDGVGRQLGGWRRRQEAD